ncbi:MAG: APC family permease, partial [Candidatus Xenobia bacterium]
MSFLDTLLGRPLADEEEPENRVGVGSGLAILGLDALTSSAYGAETAMIILLPLGVAGLRYVLPLEAIIVVLLAILCLSYLQTLGAYPTGGGSYIVARRNLGTNAGLIAAGALLVDYILTVAVGISAGVGAVVSAFPSLQPHIIGLCMGILVFITVINLRGVKETGAAFAFPAYLYVLMLIATVVIGVVKVMLSHGHPVPVVAPPPVPAATGVVSLWLLMRAFSSGCAAMTGVEAVSNGLMIFKEPRVRRGSTTLILISSIL